MNLWPEEQVRLSGGFLVSSAYSLLLRTILSFSHYHFFKNRENIF